MISLADRINLKIPPPIIGLISAILMWVIASNSIQVFIPNSVKIPLSLFFVVIGLMIDGASIVRFFQTKTTINPLKPNNTTQLVTTGIYSISRNPMYLGLLFILLGWFFYLSAPLSFLGIVFYVFYITRFQIIPEEKILQSVFGDQFTRYKNSTRRWF